MVISIINTITTFLVSSLLGYTLNIVKNYKKQIEEKKQDEVMIKTALVMMLQSNLTNTYFIYDNLKQIPDYVYKNWANLKSIYEKLGGNDYIHILNDKMKDWDIEKTDILR